MGILDAPVPNATSLVLGKLKLAGDLGGTAALPTVKNLQRIFNVKDYGAIGNGVANDSAAINAAITAANVNGGTVYVPATTAFYNSPGNVILKSNVVFKGDGYNSVIRPGATAGIRLNSVSNVTLKDFRVDGTIHVTGDQAIAIFNSSNVLIDNIDGTNIGGYGVFTHTSDNNITERITIRDSRLFGRGNADILGGGTDNSTGAIIRDITLKGNYLYQDASIGDNYTNAIDLVGVYRTRFEGNTVYGGIIFGSEQSPHRHSTIVNNIVKTANGAPSVEVGLIVGTSLTNTGDAIIVANNNIESGFIGIISGPDGQLFTNVAVIGNVIDGTGVPAAPNGGAIQLSKVGGGVVAGNVVYNSGGDGIWLSGSTGITVTGNRVSGSNNIGIRENNNSSGNFINQNDLNGNTAGNSAVGSASTSFFNNNNVNPMLNYAPGNISGAVTFRRTNGHITYATLTGNVVASFANAVVNGDIMTLMLIQDATGGRTITWPSNVKFGPSGAMVLSTVAGATDTITFVYETDGNWHELNRTAPISSSSAPDATTTTKGIVQLAGDLGGTAASPTIKSRTVSKTVAPSGYTGSADYVCDGIADDVEINAAIQAVASTGGIVEILPGTYNTTATIVNDKVGVLVRGAVVGHFAKVTYIKAASTYTTMATIANTAAGGFQDIYFDGNNTVTDGLKIGTASTTTKIKNPVVRRLRIEKFTGRGICGTGTPVSGSWDDASFENIRIATCGVGVENSSTQTSFTAGVIGGCTVGLACPASSAGKFFGTVFTSNTTDIDVQSDNFVNAYSVIGGYFESATSAILKRSVSPASSDTVAGFTFTDCSFRNQADTNPFMDLSNMGGTVAMVNCTYDAVAGSSRTILTGINTKIVLLGVGGSVDPILTGTGQVGTYRAGNIGVNNLSPANKLNVNTPSTADTAAETILSSRVTGSKPLVVQGVSGQTGRLTEWQTNSGGILAFIASGGGYFAPIGSASTAAIGFANDSDTGLYRATANALGITAGGVQRLQIDDSGFLDVKTQGIINVVDPINLQDAATKNYVDTSVSLKANDADVVKLTGAQTVADVKTFTSTPVLPGAANAAGVQALSGTTHIFSLFRQASPANASLSISALGGIAFKAGQTSNATGTFHMQIETNGQVGIGKTPTTALDVNGTITGTGQVINGTQTIAAAGSLAYTRYSKTDAPTNNWDVGMVLGNANFGYKPTTDAFLAFKNAANANIVLIDTATGRLGIGANPPTSTLQSSGSFAAPIRTVTAATTATVSDYTILANATTAAFNVTLPTAVGISGRIYNIKKIDSTANVVTIATTSSQTIDGATTYALSTQYKYLTVQSDGANYQVIGSN